MAPWTVADIPPQNGKFAIVTGANSGIGYDTALELARAGAEVIIATRNAARGEAAVARIKMALPHALVRFEALDLASLASVRDFAARIKASHGKLDILVNNAGVMALPRRRLTVDGFETQLGVNFLGHFLLTALLLPLLMKAEAPRVVQISSIAHRRGKIALDDLQAEKSYKPWRVYQQSKLAMLMFALELQRRSDAGGWGITSVAAHPGIATTELVANGPGNDSLTGRLWPIFGHFITHSSAAGALPTLLAATAPQRHPGRLLRADRLQGIPRPAGGRENRSPGAGCGGGEGVVGGGRAPHRPGFHTRPVTAAQATARRSPSVRAGLARPRSRFANTAGSAAASAAPGRLRAEQTPRLGNDLRLLRAVGRQQRAPLRAQIGGGAQDAGDAVSGAEIFHDVRIGAQTFAGDSGQPSCRAARIAQKIFEVGNVRARLPACALRSAPTNPRAGKCRPPARR